MLEKIWPINTSDWLAELKRDPYSILIEGENPFTKFAYGFWFVFKHPKGPYIKIDTEPRWIFLEKGSARQVLEKEHQAQEALETLTKQTRGISGGVIDIHPFYGPVFGTILTPMIPGFLKNHHPPDEGLSMTISLTDAGYEFDYDLTKEALAIGTTVMYPSPNGERFFKHITQASRYNPNQANRDQAYANNYGRAWDKAFDKCNHNAASPAMTLNPKNIVGLIHTLEEKKALTNLSVVKINL
jgi:hypothetical protein